MNDWDEDWEEAMIGPFWLHVFGALAAWMVVAVLTYGLVEALK